MTTPLPLAELRAFEAAARRLSFTQAAAELNVLQPAVSRRIPSLERDLGVALFLRSRPQLRLTAAGASLHAAVGQSFSQLEAALTQLRAAGRTPRVVVNTSIGFASCWLMARIAGFRARHDDIDLELRTRDGNHGADPAQCDIVVVFADAASAGPQDRQILPERILAISRPGLEGLGPDTSPPALARTRLLHLDDPDHHGDWARLLAGSGVATPVPGQGARYNSFIVYLQAILAGEGVGLGWGGLMDDLLRDGALQQVTRLEHHSTRGYVVRLTARGRRNPAAAAFRDWVVEAAAGTAGSGGGAGSGHA